MTAIVGETEFRGELESWLDANLPPGWGTSAFRTPSGSRRRDFLREWQAKLADNRWVGIHWPSEHGGRDASIVQQVIYHSVMTSRRAPHIIGNRGLSVTGPTIIVHGTDEQKALFLPRILRADDLWCTGFSEPNAGSDLASLRTSARVDGDQLVVNGSKIWTSDATFGDWMYTLVRTDSSSNKHQGITCVLIPLDAEGVTVRPIRRMTGAEGFAQVFLDEVHVPLNLVVGPIDQGWGVARTSLAHEHYTNFLAAQIRFARSGDEVLELARHVSDVTGRPRIEEPWIRGALARQWAVAQLIRVNGLRNVGRVLADGEPGPEGSIMKLFGQEAEKDLHELAIDILGPYGTLDRGAKDAVAEGKWVYRYLSTRPSTIGGGTSDVQRNVIAEKVLGMPRDE
jgi:alkylation response protein AidB-like acyl-CoA dehydrogenase